jgi:GxxExxY protein
LLESAYEACLAYELQKLGKRVDRQKPVPLFYEDVKLDCGFRADLIVDGRVAVELKCKEALHPVDEAQLLSHMRLLNLPLGLLINFHVMLLKDGIRRLANNYREPTEELWVERKKPLTAKAFNRRERRQGTRERREIQAAMSRY